MPHLRIVSDELWARANAAIDARRPRSEYPSGLENPLYGVPRDSRTLLGTLLKCGICGAPLHKGGRGGSAYFCSAAKNRKCWNKATAEHELIENAVKQVVREQLRSIDNVVDQFLRQLTLLIGDRESLRCRLKALTEKQQQLKVRIQRLLRIIESKKNPPEEVLRRIEKLRRAAAEDRSKRQPNRASAQRLDDSDSRGGHGPPPDASDRLRRRAEDCWGRDSENHPADRRRPLSTVQFERSRNSRPDYG